MWSVDFIIRNQLLFIEYVCLADTKLWQIIGNISYFASSVVGESLQHTDGIVDDFSGSEIAFDLYLLPVHHIDQVGTCDTVLIGQQVVLLQNLDA